MSMYNKLWLLNFMTIYIVKVVFSHYVTLNSQIILLLPGVWDNSYVSLVYFTQKQFFFLHVKMSAKGSWYWKLCNVAFFVLEAKKKEKVIDHILFLHRWTYFNSEALCWNNRHHCGNFKSSSWFVVILVFFYEVYAVSHFWKISALLFFPFWNRWR